MTQGNVVPSDPNAKYLKPLPPPNYPTMDMPEDPKESHIPIIQGARPDCEGNVNMEMKAEGSPVPPPPPGKLRILIGVPILAVTYEFLESFLKFWTELSTSADPRYEIGYHFAYRKPVHMAEEHLVGVAQYNKCTHILLMDDDIYDIRKADLDKLVEADKDVIGGVMYASKFPHAMCVFRRYNQALKVIDMPADTSIFRLYEVPCVCSNPKCLHPISHWDAKFCPACGATLDNMVQQADLIPFCFTLIKLSVFDKIKKPWFHCTSKYPTDSWFADRLVEAGLTEYGHMGVRLNHAGINDATRPHYLQMGMEAAKKKQSIVNISPEEMERHQTMLANKMMETEASLKSKPPFVSDKSVVNDIDNPMTLVTHGK